MKIKRAKILVKKRKPWPFPSKHPSFSPKRFRRVRSDLEKKYEDLPEDDRPGAKAIDEMARKLMG